MSRHFTYEIDERNLRVKLKDIEEPYREDAWEKFEAYAATQNKHTADSGFSGVKFSLNRNVLMLTVFAIVIVSFSLLLFNFISIKNPKKESAENLEEGKAIAAETATEAKPAVPAVMVKSVPAPTVAAVTATVAAQKEAVHTENTAAPAPDPAAQKTAAPPVADKVKEAAKKEIIQKSSADEEADLEAAEKKAEELRKKQEKRAAAALAKKIKPAVITEDTDPDVKPK